MQQFVDSICIGLSSGNGGKGAVSFRRERYIPKGGPDGGDGGKGGDVFIRVHSNLKTLTHLKNKKLYKAANGNEGRGQRMFGHAGEDLIIDVPPSTIIKDFATKLVINDTSNLVEGDKIKILSGGLGGRGNFNFKSSRNRTPRYAQPGQDGQSGFYYLELRLIADIGLVGFPSAGKSSFQRLLTNSKPKIAPYPFTTKIPNLGVFRIFDRDIIIADIPGIIEGASKGLGLGHSFLRHISKAKMLAILVDLSSPTFLTDPDILLKELASFDKNLLKKEYVLICTKIDLAGSMDNFDKLQEKYIDKELAYISNITAAGLPKLKELLIKITRN